MQVFGTSLYSLYGPMHIPNHITSMNSAVASQTVCALDMSV